MRGKKADFSSTCQQCKSMSKHLLYQKLVYQFYLLSYVGFNAVSNSFLPGKWTFLLLAVKQRKQPCRTLSHDLLSGRQPFYHLGAAAGLHGEHAVQPVTYFKDRNLVTLVHVRCSVQNISSSLDVQFGEAHVAPPASIKL